MIPMVQGSVLSLNVDLLTIFLTFMILRVFPP